MEKIRMDDFKRYGFLSGIKHSPDGKYACFAMHRASIEDNQYLSNLWLLNLGNGEYSQLTSFDTEKSFLWVDDENIIFPDVRDKKDREKKDEGEEFTQYYRICIHGGEAVKTFRIPRNVSSIKMIDEDTYIFTSEFNSNHRELSELSDSEKTEELKNRKEDKDYEVLQEIPFWSNGGGFTNRKRNRLYIYHVGTGKVEVITGEFTSVETFCLNEERTKAAIIAFTFKDRMPLVNDLYLYDLKTKKLHEVSKSFEASHYYACFLDDDTLMVAVNEMKMYGVNENEKFYTVDLKAGTYKCITPEIDIAATNSVGSDCRYGGSDIRQMSGNYFYFVSTEGDSSYVNKIDSTGKLERVAGEGGSVDGISVRNGEILYIGMKPGKLQELFQVKNNRESQITKINEWIYIERKVQKPEKLSVETSKGVIIDGWVIKPVDFDESKKYPAILDIHGGPKTVYGEVFFHEMQYWANEGYAVFFCNPRGSDGRGNEFADIRGKYGTIDYDDIMRFTDEILKMYTFIDSKRIGVTGGSYGGFMTNWIIGHTDRFAAAASQRSISNWISKFCTTDIGYFFVDDQIAATPWNNQERLWEHSPLKYADRVKTPTLFLHSEEDYRCWLAEGIQMFTAVKYHGAEARLIMFRGENHELSRSGRPKHRLRRLKEITMWFDQYLKNN